jgi:hypothetical protein
MYVGPIFVSHTVVNQDLFAANLVSKLETYIHRHHAGNTVQLSVNIEIRLQIAGCGGY